MSQPPLATPAPTFVVLWLWLQGVDYLLTGVWPLVSMSTFEMVTGPKLEHWLVRTVGVLIAANAVVILHAAWARRFNRETALLALGDALALTGVDVVSVSLGVIPPIYRAGAAAEVVLIAGWIYALTRYGAC